MHSPVLKSVSTEKAIKVIESQNKLLFEVGRRSSKDEIKKLIEETFKIKVSHINSFIRKNKKYAYIQLKGSKAIDLATKLGMM